MSDEAQKRAVEVLAALLAHVLSDRVANRLISEPEYRRVRDDAKEALIKGSFRFASVVLASVVIRQFVAKRWGS